MGGHGGQQRCAKRSFGKTKKIVVKSSAGKKKKALPKLKKNISPGSILILLAGRFRGRRVVYLKQLASGMLLCTGPFGVNGVPLKRANPRYCIGTSTSVKLDKAADFSKIDDDYFAREKKVVLKFFDVKDESAVPQKKKDMQKKLDESIIKGLSADMKAYLKGR